MIKDNPPAITVPIEGPYTSHALESLMKPVRELLALLNENAHALPNELLSHIEDKAQKINMLSQEIASLLSHNVDSSLVYDKISDWLMRWSDNNDVELGDDMQSGVDLYEVSKNLYALMCEQKIVEQPFSKLFWATDVDAWNAVDSSIINELDNIVNATLEDKVETMMKKAEKAGIVHIFVEEMLQHNTLSDDNFTP